MSSALLVLIGTGLNVAHASLGEDLSSIAADAEALHGVQHRQAGPPADSVVVQIDNGVLVEEYLDTSGRVFAVLWRGPAMPDLQILLGSYFSAYTAGLAGRVAPGRKRAIEVVDAQLHVRIEGHLRDYRGMAYLQDRVPSGVTLQMLR